ncbi:type IV pilin-like G/H family protein [Argonema galeatum]|uniref:type IV pilin-like G/H family protein n=1 Tax=Argonema galeatum TaxID=2942762 RepID=UPI0020139983|nr:type IV pilin-like G/H family protein [Argonema galeatum]MCL1463598.1 type IV pilin-like G/H family protein [Argonema galeatum A003/A1]
MAFKLNRVLMLTKAYPSILIALLTVLSIGINATAKIPTINSNRNSVKEASVKQFGPIIRAKQDEGKSTISSLNRAQQAYYLENSRFASNFGQLGLGISAETGNYSYKVAVVNPRSARSTASAKDTRIRSYTGAVFAIGSGNNTTTIAGICQSNRASRTPPPMPRLVRNNIQCPAGSTKL